MESVAVSVRVTVDKFVCEAPLLMLTEPEGAVVSGVDPVVKLHV